MTKIPNDPSQQTRPALLVRLLIAGSFSLMMMVGCGAGDEGAGLDFEKPQGRVEKKGPDDELPPSKLRAKEIDEDQER